MPRRSPPPTTPDEGWRPQGPSVRRWLTAAPEIAATVNACACAEGIGAPELLTRWVAERAAEESVDRACVACDHTYKGGLSCPECGQPGKPLFPQGEMR